MKRLLFICLSFLIGSAALAATRPHYRIELRNGSEVLSEDRPSQRGSVLTFHAYPGGALTGLPEEEVAEVTAVHGPAAGRRVFNRTSLEDVAVVPAPPHELAPGEVIYLGPTGGEPSPAATGMATAAPSIPGGVYDPRMAIYGGYGGAPRTAPQPGTSGDLARAISAPPPTANPPVGPNGFPATTAASVPVDANGFPLTAGTTTSVDENGFAMMTTSPAPAIGPDGMPVLSPNGSPGSSAPVIGPDGTPVLAPSGAPGSAPPVIGPNGTPVLAPPGAPGSSPPTIGPNGYPSAPPPSPRR